jgi:murein DD-endopeptidase MepM/ murein hydrolase activator NlpD
MKKLFKKSILVFIFLFFLFGSFFVFPITSSANIKEIENLTSQIQEKRKQLEKLDIEIAAQRKLLRETSGQATTLQSKINSLEASRKKIINEIKSTETQIEKAELTINKLDLEITDKQKIVDEHSAGIAQSIRRTNAIENKSLVERFLSSESFSNFWTELEQNLTIQNTFKNAIDYLLSISQELRETKAAKAAEKAELAQYKKELDGQVDAVAQTKAEQQSILIQTKNKEAEYQKLLTQKESQKKAFENEMLDIESKIKILIDPNSYSAPKRGVFAWPLSNIVITQQFGGSQFAKTNPGIYGRPFHPGTDFGASIGSKISSIGPGTVRSIGNTDAYAGCYAWGKWILIDHTNGISSLYAHLSSILVSPGDNVSTGDVIALSGNTGVTTGPHLHLTLYATQGVKVGKYGSYKPGASGCAATDATGPFADLDAYLDPMSYLPSL